MKPALITEIETLLGGVLLHPAPVRVNDPLGALMAYKQGMPKYQMEGETLIGLNLSNAGMSDEQWQGILGLPDFQAGRIRALNLSDNQISRFELSRGMAALERLDLSGNQLESFSLPAGFGRLYDLNLEDNPLHDPPEEIMKQGRRATLRYLQQLAAQGERQVYEVKMLIVGEGHTGKTTLWNILQDPNHPVPDKTQASTVGIEIKEGWAFDHPDFPGTPFLANLWDFGGQEIQYMTHQFFLTRRSLYVLLADGRSETSNFPYWLKMINLLGVDAKQKEPLPVLVVLNERGNPIARMPYDPKEAKKDFPRLSLIKREVDFAVKDGRLKALPEDIQAILAKLPHLPLKIPAYWDAVRRELYELRETENYIDFNRFREICMRHGIPEGDEQQMTALSQLLHDLGVLLHFHEDLSLRAFLVLSPDWAVNAVYEILRHKEVEENQGRFGQRLLQKVWARSGYTPFEQGHLLNLMLKDNFEVCFRAEEGQRTIYIAPQLLPAFQPAFAWPPKGALLRYTYQYPFMPKGIAGRLIVRLHEHLETEKGRKVVWEKGMVLKKDGCRALVQESEDAATGLKLIKIEVGGASPESRRFVLRDIREELEGIHRRSFLNLRYVEKIPCCCPACRDSDSPYFIERSYLEELKADGIETERCRQSRKDVSVRELLGEVFPAEGLAHRVRPAGQSGPKKVFFSYSRHDRPYLEALLKHLSILKRTGKLLPWDDSHLQPGEQWDDTIKAELAKADIILLLLSSNALATDYIWEVEMKTALLRGRRGETKVVPVILDHCDWKEMEELKALNALPLKGKPMASWPQAQQSEAWMQVVEGIKKII